MITGPRTDGQRTPLQDFETLYIGGAEPAVVRRGLRRYDGAQIKTMRDCEENDDAMVRIVPISESWGRIQWNKHEVER
jgi:hypothetical protein